MADNDGSRWYFPTFEGLIDAKHQVLMGPAVWLYLYCIKYAFVARNEGELSYNHPQAADELGVSVMTVKRWFATLQEHEYIETRARKPYHLEIAVSNWRTIEEWYDAREREKEGQSTDRSITRGNKRSNKRNTENDTSYTLSIKLSGYLYPNGSHGDAAQTCLKDAFLDLVEKLKEAKNKPATLRQIYKLCFGGNEDTLPDYGYIGKVAKKVGGPERLAQIMWELTTRPPIDPLGYIIKVYGGKPNGPNQRPDRRRDPDETFLDPASGQLVRKDPGTGELVPVP
jgi:hypothetical protein